MCCRGCVTKQGLEYVMCLSPYYMSFPDYMHYAFCHPLAPIQIVCLLCLPSGWGSVVVFTVRAKAWQARKTVCMDVWHSVSSLRNTSCTVEMMGSASLALLACGRWHGILVDQLQVKQRAKGSAWTTKHIAVKMRPSWIKINDFYHWRNLVILQS